VNGKIIFVQNIEIFPDQEHILVLTEDTIDIFRLKREIKVSNIKFHDSDIIELFVLEPVSEKGKVVEDAK